MMMNSKKSRRRDELEGSLSQGAPPWLFFWIISFLLTLQEQWSLITGRMKFYIENRLVFIEQLPAAGLRFSYTYILEYAIFMLMILPLIVIFFGLATLVFPWIRSINIIHKHNLIEQKELSDEWLEISDFLRLYISKFTLLTSKYLSSKDPFVFPGKTWKANMAIFTPLLIAWKKNRPVAESVLVHESSHIRKGDYLLLGSGSALAATIELSVKLFLTILIITPVAFAVTNMATNEILNSSEVVEKEKELGEFENDLSQLTKNVNGGKIVTHASQETSAEVQEFRQQITEGESSIKQLKLEIIQLKKTNAVVMVLQFLAEIFLYLFAASLAFIGLVSILIFPIMAIWTTELGADHFTLNNYGEAAKTLASLNRPDRFKWRTWFFRSAIYPPTPLRRRFRNMGKFSRSTLITLLFPLAYLVRLIVTLIVLIPFQIHGNSITKIIALQKINILSYMHNNEVQLIGCALFILAWLPISRFWISCFGGSGPGIARGRLDTTDFHASLLAASICLGLASIGVYGR